MVISAWIYTLIPAAAAIIGAAVAVNVRPGPTLASAIQHFAAGVVFAAAAGAAWAKACEMNTSAILRSVQGGRSSPDHRAFYGAPRDSGRTAGMGSGVGLVDDSAGAWPGAAGGADCSVSVLTGAGAGGGGATGVSPATLMRAAAA